jgi:hypothetical protein
VVEKAKAKEKEKEGEEEEESASSIGEVLSRLKNKKEKLGKTRHFNSCHTSSNTFDCCLLVPCIYLHPTCSP